VFRPMFADTIKVDDCVLLNKAVTKTTSKPRTVSVQEGGDDETIDTLLVSSIQNVRDVSNQTTWRIQPCLKLNPDMRARARKNGRGLLGSAPSSASNIVCSDYWGAKSKEGASASEPKPDEVNPNFRTPPQHIFVGSLLVEL
jgi:hypothetical protein